jgi:hypothetical protein
MTSASLARALLELLGQLLHFFLGAVAIVFAHDLVFLLRFGGFVAVAADVANGHLGFFGELFDARDELLADLSGQRRDVQANQPSVVLRCEAQAAGEDRLLDVFDRAGIERTDDDLRRLRRTDRSELLDRRRRAIDFHAQRIDQARIGAAGANAGQGVLQHVGGFFHPLFNVQENIVDWHGVNLN